MVVAVVLISALLAMFRGFVREVLSIAAWVAAAILAYVFYEQLVPYVSQYIDNPTLAVGVSAAAIFLVSLIIVSLITMKISDFVMDSPVGVLDRSARLRLRRCARPASRRRRGDLLQLAGRRGKPPRLGDDARRRYPELARLGDQLIAAIPDDPEAAIRGAFEEPGDAAGADRRRRPTATPAAPTPPPRRRPTPTTAPDARRRQAPSRPGTGLNQLIDGASEDTGNTDHGDARPRRTEERMTTHRLIDIREDDRFHDECGVFGVFRQRGRGRTDGARPARAAAPRPGGGRHRLLRRRQLPHRAPHGPRRRQLHQPRGHRAAARATAPSATTAIRRPASRPCATCSRSSPRPPCGGFAVAHNGNITNARTLRAVAARARLDLPVDLRHRGDPPPRRDLDEDLA